MRELALFAGAGGGILGGHLLGWRTVCAVEWDAYAASVLVARQNDKILPPFPIWDDVQTFDGRAWRGRVDVVSGGFPCTDISTAGRGAGIDGEASGMWRHMARIIGEVRPQYVFVENSPALVHRGLARVLGDLAALGYDARWGVLGAADAGAPHRRDRIWIVAADADCVGDGKQHHHATSRPDVNESSVNVADAHGSFLERERISGGIQSDDSGAWISRAEAAFVADATSERLPQQRQRGHTGNRQTNRSWQANHIDHDCQWWATEPDVGRVAHGVANRVDRLRCLGNGQVPEVVRLAWRTLIND
jgi:DNA (cytosine-5)-methyltransferase 1